MRIGIITIVKVNNYGAELQAFATQKKMEMMGYDVEVLIISTIKIGISMIL